MKKLIPMLILVICGLLLIAGNAVAGFINMEVIIGTFPEPTAMLLIGSGLVGLSAIGRKKLVRK